MFVCIQSGTLANAFAIYEKSTCLHWRLHNILNRLSLCECDFHSDISSNRDSGGWKFKGEMILRFGCEPFIFILWWMMIYECQNQLAWASSICYRWIAAHNHLFTFRLCVRMCCQLLSVWYIHNSFTIKRCAIASESNVLKPWSTQLVCLIGAPGWWYTNSSEMECTHPIPMICLHQWFEH